METPRAACTRAAVDRAMRSLWSRVGCVCARLPVSCGAMSGNVPDGSGRVLLHTNGKPQREVWVIITGECLQALKGIRPEGANESSGVFGLSETLISQRLKRMCKEVGIGPREVSGNTPRATLYRLIMEIEGAARMLQQQLRLKQFNLPINYDNMREDTVCEWMERTFTGGSANVGNDFAQGRRREAHHLGQRGRCLCLTVG